MSRTIDERVVSMQFDNRNFENNVKTSMGTLERLKQSLNLKGASKGFDELGAAAKNVKLAPLANSVEQVRLKFSAMEIFAVTALTNIANKAYHAGERIVRALTIDPVKTGLQEYETQINSVQTIMANVGQKGKTLDDVNAALEELNEYADLTIYNFTEMTRNIGLFTNAGVGLDESVAAIKGFSNAAAMAGTDATRTAGAMYQLSQAMSSGKVQLMDWRSLEQANITGERFQETIKMTARAHGIAIDSMIEKEGSLRDTLSSGWLTADLMSEALNHYTLSTETMSEAEQKANRERLKSIGYTEEQIDKLFELGTEATNAATKVKTFSQMWGVLQETAQSGWSKTWQIIFGDFEEAKALFTPLTNFFSGIIDKISDARNRFLEMVLGSPVGGIINTLKGITTTAKGAVDTIQDLGDVVNRVIRGEFGNQGDYGNPNYRRDRLTEAGYNYARVQNLVNETLGCSYRLTEELTESQNGLTESQSNTIDELLNMSDAQLNEIGVTEDQIAALKELKTISDKTGISIEKIIEDPESVSGRSLLIEAFASIGNTLKDVAHVAKVAWREIFDPIAPKVASALYDSIASFRKLVADFDLTKDVETVDKLRRTFKGLFALLELLYNLVSTPLKTAWNVLTTVLGLFDLNVLDLTAAIGDCIVYIRDWVNEHLSLKKIIETVYSIVMKCVDAIRNWYKANEELFNSIGRIISDAVSKLAAKIGEWRSVGSDLVEGFAEGFWSGVKAVFKKVGEFAIKVLEIIRDKFDTHSPSKETFKIGWDVIQGFINGIIEGVKTLFRTISTVFTKVVNAIKGYFSDLDFTPAKKAFENVSEFLTKVFDKLKDVFTSVDWKYVFNAALSTGTMLTLYKFASALEALASPLEGVEKFLDNVGGGINKALTGLAKSFKADAFKKNAQAIFLLAGALAVLVLALGGLVWLIQKSGNDIWKAVGALAALAVILGLLAWAVSRFSQASFSFKKGEGLKGKNSGLMAIIGIAASLVLVAIALKKLGDIDADKVPSILVMFTGIMVAIGSLMAIAALTTRKYANAKAIESLGKMMTKLGVALILITAAIWLIGKMDGRTILQGVSVIGILMLFCAGLIAVSKFAGEHADKAGKMLMKMSIAMLIMVGVIKTIAKMDPGDVAFGITVIAAIEILFSALVAVSYFAGEHADKAGKMVFKMSVAMLIMAGVIKIIAGLSAGDIVKGLAVIAAFEILIGALIALTYNYNGKSVAKLGTMLLSFSVSLLILVGVIWLIGMLEESAIRKGIAVVGLLGIMLAALIKSTEKAQNVKGSLYAMTAAIAILAIAVIALSFLDERRLAVATAALMGVLWAFSKVISATSSLREVKMGPVITMVGALLIIAGALYILSSLPDTDGVIKSAIGLGLALVAFSYSLKMLDKITVDKSVYPLLLAMITIMGLLTIFLVAMCKLEIENAIPNATALAILALALSTAVVILSKQTGVTNRALYTLGILTVCVAALGGMLIAMSAANVKEAIPNAVALGILAVALSAAMVVLGYTKEVSGTALAALAVMSGCMIFMGMILTAMSGVKGAIANATALGILANLLATSMVILGHSNGTTRRAMEALVVMSACMIPLGLILKAMSGTKGAISNAVALGILANALATAMVILGYTKEVSATALAALLMMSGCMVFMGMILKAMDGVQEAIPNAVALSILANALSVALIILGVAGRSGVSALKGVGLLTLMAIPLLAFVGVLAVMQNVSKATKNTENLVSLAIALTLLLIPLTVVGAFGLAAITGVGLLLTMAVPLLAFVGVLALMQNIQNATTNTLLLITMMQALTDMLIKLSIIAPLAVVAEIAVVGLVGAIAAIGTLATGVGYLMDKYPTLEKFLDKGLPVLTKVASGIGEFVGNLVSSFLTSATEGLGEFGKNLTEFWNGASVFIEGVKTVDNSVLTGIRTLAQALGLLISAEFMDLAVKWVSKGQSSFSKLGKDLSDFATNCETFFDIAGDIKPSAMNGFKTLVEALAEISKGELLKAIFEKFFPDTTTSMKSFGEQITYFGQAMVDFSETVAGNIDESAVTAAANAGKTVAEMADSLPDDPDSWLGKLKGKTTIEEFGKQLVPFGKAMVSFSSTVAGKIDSSGVESAANAGQMLSDLASSLTVSPDTVAGKLYSKTSMGEFADQLVSFGNAMVRFSSTVSGKVDADAVTNAKNCGQMLSDLGNTLPESPKAFKAWWSGTTIDFATFGNQFMSFGIAMVNFSAATKGMIDEEAVTAATNAGKMLAGLANELPEGWKFSDIWNGKDNIDLDDFGKQIVGFAEGIVDFSSTLSEGGVDSSLIKTATEVGTALAELDKNVPEEFDLSRVSDGLSSFGTAIVDFSEQIKGNIDMELVSSATDVAKTLAETASIMPDEVDMAVVTNGLDKFATGIKDFSEKLNDVDITENVARAADLGKDLAYIAGEVPPKTDMENFVSAISDFGQAINDFVEDARTVANDQTTLDNVTQAATKIGNALRTLPFGLDLAYFTANLADFGQALVDFSNNVSGKDGIDTYAIELASTAGTNIGKMLKSLPQSLDVQYFVDNLAGIGQALFDFSQKVTQDGFDSEAIKTAATAGIEVVNMVNAIQYNDVSTFVSQLGALGTALTDFCNNIPEDLSSNKVTYAASAIRVISDMCANYDSTKASQFTGSIGEVGTAISTFVTTVNSINTEDTSRKVRSVKNVLSNLNDTAENVDVKGLVDASAEISGMSEALKNVSAEGIDAFIQTLKDAVAYAITAGSNLVIGLASGMSSMASQVQSTTMFILSCTKNAISSHWIQFYSTGRYLVEGFASGIRNNTYKAVSAATAMSKACYEASRRWLNVNSPSKVFRKLGTSVPEGFAMGISQMSSLVVGSAEDMAQTAIEGTKGALSRIADAVNSDIDTQPTIRPVLDLSDVTSGTAKLSDMLNVNPSLGLLTNVGSISSMMNSNQNGTNSDVISAIKDLGRKIGNASGDTYSINGITYDDGSNIKDAVQTIVRAARMERRM